MDSASAYSCSHNLALGVTMNIKKSIRVALAQKEMTQEGLAKLVGMTASNMSLLLNRESIPTSRLSQIATALDMKVVDLLKLGED